MRDRPTLSCVCGQCGSVGFRCADRDGNELASNEEVWIAQQVAALLATSNLPPPAQATMRVGLAEVLHRTCGGSPVRAALGAGLPRSLVWGWLHDKNLPSLPALMRLCYHLNADLPSLLRGSYVREVTPGPISELFAGGRHRYRKQLLSKDQLLAALQASSSESPPPSGSELARRLASSSRELHRFFPESYRAVTARYGAFAATRRDEVFERTKAQYAASIAALRENGATVSYMYVQKESGIVAHSSNASRQRALREALEEAG